MKALRGGACPTCFRPSRPGGPHPELVEGRRACGSLDRLKQIEKRLAMAKWQGLPFGRNANRIINLRIGRHITTDEVVTRVKRSD